MLGGYVADQIAVDVLIDYMTGDHLVFQNRLGHGEIENVIDWWKNKASRRYDKMIAENKVRTELEVWNQDTMNKIDIIR